METIIIMNNAAAKQHWILVIKNTLAMTSCLLIEETIFYKMKLLEKNIVYKGQTGTQLWFNFWSLIFR